MAVLESGGSEAGLPAKSKDAGNGSVFRMSAAIEPRQIVGGGNRAITVPSAIVVGVLANYFCQSSTEERRFVCQMTVTDDGVVVVNAELGERAQGGRGII